MTPGPRIFHLVPGPIQLFCHLAALVPGSNENLANGLFLKGNATSFLGLFGQISLVSERTHTLTQLLISSGVNLLKK